MKYAVAVYIKVEADSPEDAESFVDTKLSKVLNSSAWYFSELNTTIELDE